MSKLVQINSDELEALLHQIEQSNKLLIEKEAYAQRVKKFFEFISKVNDLVLNAENVSVVYREICKISVDYGGFLFAFIGIKDNDTQAIVPTYWAGHENGYIDIIRNTITTKKVPGGNGPTGRAMRDGKYYYCNDIANDPVMYVWRDEAIKRGFRSSITLPIIVNKETVAIIAMYAPVINFFTEEELHLLTRVNENINYALSYLDTEHKRKQAEMQLQKVLQAVEQSMASIVITDVEGNIEYVNPAFSHLTGYTFQEAIGQNPRILKSGHTSDTEYKHIWNNLINTRTWSGEFCNRKKNGELYWEYAVISPILNNEGQITNYVAVQENITERKKLTDLQNQQLLIFENSEAYIAMSDIKRNFIYANKAMRHVLEIEDSEDITKLNIEEFRSEKSKKFSNELNELLIKDNKWVGENYYKSRSGKDISVWQVIVVHKNEEGIPVKLSTTAIDISKRKEAEKELFNLNSELRALSQHLQKISEIEKKEIARDIHDELGQNLTALNLRVSWIKHHLNDDKNTLEKRFDDLTEEIKDTMAAFRRIHSSLHPALLEDLGLEASLNWLVNSAKSTTDIRMEFYSNIDSKLINFEKALPMYRIVQESLTNIMRYSRAREVSVNLMQKENRILLTIKDNGCGFDISKVDTAEHHGILGMRERVYAIGGKFTINSVIGKGTEVMLEVDI